MKKIKYIISSIIIFIALLIVSEQYKLYVQNFPTRFDNTSMYIQGYDVEEMKSEVLAKADECDIDFFLFNYSLTGSTDVTITVYGTENVEKYINDNLHIYAGTTDSLFFGSTTVIFKGFEDIETLGGDNYYLIGDKENEKRFKVELINKYAGNHVQDGYSGMNNAIIIWAISVGVIVMLSMFEIYIKKKESLIRVVNGEQISNIIIKNSILDAIVYIGVFAISLYLLHNYTYIYHEIRISITAMIILIIINTLIYFSLYKLDFKNVFSNTVISNKTMNLLYFMKVITVVLTATVVSSGLVFVINYARVKSQESFFEYYKDYDYVHVDTKLRYDEYGNIVGGDMTDIINEEFYRKTFDTYNPILLSEILEDEGGTSLIWANKNAIPYLKTQIPELNNIEFDKEMYIVIPEKIANDEYIEFITTIIIENGFMMYDETFDYTYDVITYEDNANIIAINENTPNFSNKRKNPIIALDNIDYGTDEKYKGMIKLTGPHREIMYGIDDMTLYNEFVEEHNLYNEHNSTTNVLDNYNHHLRIVKYFSDTNLLFAVLILFLESLFMVTIIRLKYKSSAMEITIKKTLGYSNFERVKTLYLVTIITYVIAIITAIIASIIFDVTIINIIIVVCLVLLIFEMIMLNITIKLYDKTEIQKVLKGGIV